jgi:hypothetical protein
MWGEISKRGEGSMTTVPEAAAGVVLEHLLKEVLPARTAPVESREECLRNFRREIFVVIFAPYENTIG